MLLKTVRALSSPSPDDHRWLRRLYRYGLSLVCAFGMIWILQTLSEHFPHVSVSLNIPLIIAAGLSYFLGAGPGLAFGLVVGVAAWHGLFEPRGSWDVSNVMDALRLIGYFGLTIITAVIVGSLQQAKSGLESSKAHVHRILDSIADYFVAMDADGRIAEINTKAAAFLGRPAGDLIGQVLWDVHPAFQESEFPTLLRIAVTEGKALQIESPSVVQPGRWLELHFHPSGSRADVYFRDITERKKVEEALRGSEERLRLILDRGPEGLIVLDAAGHFLSWNQEALRMHGYTGRDDKLEEFTTTDSHWELLHMDGRPVPADQWPVPRMIRGESFRDYELIVRRKDQHWEKALSYYGAFIPGANGQASMGLLAVRDVSRRRQADEALHRSQEDLARLNRTLEERVVERTHQLQESEERYRALVEGAQGYGIFMLDPDGRIASWNRAAERIHGYRDEEIMGRPYSIFYPEEAVKEGEPERWLEKAREEGRLSGEGWRLHKDGHRFYASFELSVLRDSSGGLRGFVKVVQDATQRQMAEEELKKKDREILEARKMEAVGQLAGGIAHDFNNIMTGIRGLVEEAREVSPHPRAQESLGEVLKASERASALTRQLLAFGRRQVISPVVLNLNKIVADIMPLLQRSLREDIVLQTTLKAGLGNVRMDRNQFEQVLLNLILNSKDAIPTGGRILIETRNVEIGELQPDSDDMKPGSYVMLCVTDTGHGMSDEIRARAFEPFFTTKSPGRGTGMGLAMVYGIVKQHGGNIRLDSRPGEGTNLRIYLPRIASPALPDHPSSRRSKETGGHEAILVVEDESIVRSVVQRALKKRGYRVMAAEGAETALRMLEKHADPINLLLTDVVMPGMNGRDLAREVQRRWPQTRVLFMSGHSEDILMHGGMLDPDVAFIEKAFPPEELAFKVRETLDAPSVSRSAAPPSR